VVALAFFKRIK